MFHECTFHTARVLLTDSGHYLLPTDRFDDAKEKPKADTAVEFVGKVTADSEYVWDDISDIFPGIEIANERQTKRKRGESMRQTQ